MPKEREYVKFINKLNKITVHELCRFWTQNNEKQNPDEQILKNMLLPVTSVN